jgi:hypothetical protein
VGKIVDAESGGIHIKAELDFDSLEWAPIGIATLPPEGEFPFVAEFDGKRYELYSDETFDEVEPDPDEDLED